MNLAVLRTFGEIQKSMSPFEKYDIISFYLTSSLQTSIFRCIIFAPGVIGIGLTLSKLFRGRRRREQTPV